ncbi:MAG: kelch repeat-containing protein [Bryobacteraceae bacterium]
MRFAIIPLFAMFLSAQELQFSAVQPDGLRPSARFDGTIAYDPPSNRIFLFGGEDTTARNDLWAYAVETRQWRAISPAGVKPDARSGHTLNYDPIRRRLILFGGQASGFFSDVWAYDIAADQWTRLADNGAGPSRRYGHSGIYDAARNRIVISHGFTDRGRFDDTWAFDLASNRWSDISPGDGRPLRRCLHHAVHDPAGDQMFLYGGCASGFGPCPLGDLWAFNLRTNQWKEVRTTVNPPPRQHYGLAFDEARRRLVLFGGSGNALYNDTWEFDPASLTWAQLNIAAPPTARLRHQGVYAPAPADAIFFFGGVKNSAKTDELLSLAPARPTIVNAFSQAPGPLAPGTLATLYGAGFPANPAITVAGLAAPILYSSPRQINLRIPDNAPLGRTTVLNVPVTIVERAPGLFPAGFRTADVIVLFATGANESLPAPVSLQISRNEAEILYAGPAPGVPGVMQINARISPTTPSAITVALRVGAAETTGTITIHDTP